MLIARSVAFIRDALDLIVCLFVCLFVCLLASLFRKIHALTKTYILSGMRKSHLGLK